MKYSRLQHGLQLIMARYTRMINRRPRPCCNRYVVVSNAPYTHLDTDVVRTFVFPMRGIRQAYLYTSASRTHATHAHAEIV